MRAIIFHGITDGLRIGHQRRSLPDPMPTLFRFLFVCATIVGFAYLAMWSLATFVEPRDRDITVRLPSERLNPQP